MQVHTRYANSTRATSSENEWESFCLTSTEMRLFIRDGDERVKAWKQVPTWKTKNAMDHCQNNKNVKAVSAHRCAATSVLCNCCLYCCVEQSHKDNVHSSAVEKRLMQKKSNFQAQLHLPTFGLFWANLRVQHHLPPLDLTWTRRSVLTSSWESSSPPSSWSHLDSARDITQNNRPESPTVTHQHCHIIQQYFRIFREKV